MFEVSSDIYFIVYNLYYVGQNDNLGTRVGPINRDEGSTISGIKSLASNDRVCNFVKVDRGQVRVSHCLANWARTERQTLFSFGSGPDVFLQELEQERLVNPIA
jgi:hypothetical protein